MGNLMDSRFQGLQFTHALVNGNALFFQMVVAVCGALDILKGNRHRRRLFQRGEKILIYHALKHGAKCITDDLLFIKGDQVIPYKKPIGIRDTNELALNDLRNKSGITPLTLTNPLGASTYLVHLDDLFDEPYYTSPSKINWIVVPDKNSYGKPHKLEIATFSKLLIKSICNSGVNGQQLVDNIFSLLSGIHGVIYLPTKRIDEAYHNLEEIISNNMS